jgi:hypothetical protein
MVRRLLEWLFEAAASHATVDALGRCTYAPAAA